MEYLLNDEERQLICGKVSAIWVSESQKYYKLQDKDLAKPEIKTLVMDSMKQALLVEGITAEVIAAIEDKISNSYSWSYTATKLINNLWCYDYSYHGKNRDEKGSFSIDTLPMWYQPNLSLDDKANLLSIPSECLYIEAFTFDNIRLCKAALGIVKNNGEWLKVISTPITDSLHQIGTKALKEKDTIIVDGGGMVEDYEEYAIHATNAVDVIVPLSEYNQFQFKNPNADKMFSQLKSKALTNGFQQTAVRLTLNEIMQLRGLSDRKTAIEQIKKDLDFLYHVSFHQTKITDEATSSGDIRILQSKFDYVPVKGGTTYFQVELTDKLLQHLRKGFIQSVPSQLFKEKNGNAYTFLKEFLVHCRRNPGKRTQNTLSVAKLLQRSTLPLYDDQQKGEHRGQYRQRIIQPFIAALDKIEQLGIFSYELRKPANGNAETRLTEQELQQLHDDYYFFASLMVEVHWIKQPDYSHLVEKKKARLQAVPKQKRRRGRPKKNTTQGV